ncbi:hypothetical protein MSG28_008439 [Choristoneura fumiferana]|uniref:Uncharacterized protein n=3 Tax=Choristoneura fumiferana TaxID=7141 RepID=A0ACC0J626_CHOFU|nr:hypothetical protein MSG28_008439 [Choristoneura fumiferana]KAI8419775.1 hypothetical protein MSG28_008439 [Choristoneura fumiferana]KAI8419778.1 hypothetical protein MSG28_008439 [Choristoneura fumiferana]
MARKGQVSIQDNVENDEEFEAYLQAHIHQLIYLSVGAKDEIQLTEEDAKELLYMSDVEPNEACIHALLKGEALLG